MNEANEILLAPPIEPAPVGMSFAGPGWIMVYIVLAFILLYIAIRLIIRYRKNSYRRMALSALKTLTPSEPSALIEALSILKSTAMLSYGRSGIARLTGMKLFDHLNRIYPAFDTPIALLVSGTVYSNSSMLTAEDQRQFFAQTENWIRRHGV